jgi:DNA-directed RNA polymerase subunit M/transcription elongation factor TFIIS
MEKEKRNRYWKLSELRERIKKYNALYENRGEVKRIDCTEYQYLEHGNICSTCGTNKLRFSRNVQERANDEGTTLVMICENNHDVRIY